MNPGRSAALLSTLVLGWVTGSPAVSSAEGDAPAPPSADAPALRSLSLLDPREAAGRSAPGFRLELGHEHPIVGGVALEWKAGVRAEEDGDVAEPSGGVGFVFRF